MAENVDAEKIWSEVLTNLQLTMTDATFRKWLAPSVGISLIEGTLTVGAHNPYAQEWLAKRLHQRLVEEATRVLGTDTKIEVVPLPKTGKPATEHVQVVGVYLEKRTEIVQPHKQMMVSDYFRRHWLPLLGPTLGWTILALRRRAYRNYKTGETRDGFRCTYSDLAREAGVKHWRTISRAFKKPCTECKKLHKRSHSIAEHFVLEQGPVYQTSKRFSRHIRVGTRFRILLDDPLTPGDEKRVEAST